MNNVSIDVLEVNNYIVKHRREFNKEIGKMIKEWRLKKKISIEEMSCMTFMAPSYINQLERGTNGISLNKFILICNALEINLKEVLEIYIYKKQTNEDVLYSKLQEGKCISENILEYIKCKM
ncbi:MAG: helix-turn-helix transcriptional regulator [Clostridia bacterium]|nr:helix-turn-helix transcriptional regulator [Clostridia bacterium]